MADGSGAGGCPYHVPATLEERIKQWSVYQPWLQDDPVPYFKEIRDHSPIVWSEELGGYWMITRYEDMEWVARNPEIFSNSFLAIPPHDVFKEKSIPIQLDGNHHRRWRQALSELFNPSMVNHFTPQIRRAAADTIAAAAERGNCEFISEIAVRLPAEAFLITFGIDRSRMPQILEYKEYLRQQLPKANNDDDVVAAAQPLWDFFGEAIDKRRAEGIEGRRDVLSGLLRMRFDGRQPTREEMINVAFMNMLAAFDTTTAAMAVVFLYMAEHPEVQDLVVAQPDRIPAVVEELIRHDPVSATARLVVQDVERHGITMKKGQMVLVPWGMSGLDPAVFDNPDEVDFDRPTMRQLVFAIGPHRCLGMHLARRVIRTAMEEWHARVPRYGLTEGIPPVRHFTTVRGVTSLHLTYPIKAAA
ncbi:cytochrome P450 [Micromonospora sp. DT233]|uniref:cytochrome P450 n=1 Tax=Micromonospora sp. DT233 TaxID=3393432 RepID=UPI003CE888CD